MAKQRMSAREGILLGMAAGAAGTTALNAFTYLDIAVTGRAPSKTPQETVEKLADAVHVTIPGTEEIRGNRISGLGPLSGVLVGVSIGAAMGLARAAGWRSGVLGGVSIATIGALLGGNTPMTLLKVTDPREWSPKDWLSDILPHLAYGLVTALTLHAAAPPHPSSRK